LSSLPSQLAPDRVKRQRASRGSMFWRMLFRAAILRRGRAASALLAMVVAAAVVTTMLNLFVDVQAKLRKEFRNYGANVVVVARDGEALPPNALQRVTFTVAGRGLAVQFAYAVARTTSGQSVVVSGTDFVQVRKLNRWWSVSAWPSASQQALVGVRAAALVSPQSQPFDLSFGGRLIHLSPVGTLQTGAAEDSRIYLSLRDFEAWTQTRPSTIEVAVSGTPEEVTSVMQKLSEARVLGKTRATLLATAVLIILTATLCVLATLTGWVFDRRRDFAIMKALGASQRLISGFVAAEAVLLGGIGAVIGFGFGLGGAAWIGRANFHAPVVPRFSVFPAILAGSVAVALIAAILPIFMLRRVQPAMILRGE
jgi:putative ABC transport system permease protein